MTVLCFGLFGVCLMLIASLKGERDESKKKDLQIVDLMKRVTELKNVIKENGII